MCPFSALNGDGCTLCQHKSTSAVHYVSWSTLIMLTATGLPWLFYSMTPLCILMIPFNQYSVDFIVWHCFPLLMMITNGVFYAPWEGGVNTHNFNTTPPRLRLPLLITPLIADRGGVLYAHRRKWLNGAGLFSTFLCFSKSCTRLCLCACVCACV